MKILITGATGFVGKQLTSKLLDEGHEIHVLSRDAQKAKGLFPQSQVKTFDWHNHLELPPVECLSGIEGVINLMGENIGAKRWSADQKRKLKESRINATQNLITLIENNLRVPLKFFISASAVGIYPVNQKKIITETTEPANSYLADLCRMWEETLSALTLSERKVIIRTAVVLEKGDGALKKMLPPFKLGLGGPIGDGNQMMSWIHLDDLVSLYLAAVKDDRYIGIFNATAPHPVCNFDFTKALGSALHRPTLFPVPALALKIAFGEMSCIILDSQAVISERLKSVDFHFKYETIDRAFAAIFKRE